MVEETISNTGAVPMEVSADAGYYSAKAVDEIGALGVDPFIAPFHRTGIGCEKLHPPWQTGPAGSPRTHTLSSVSQGPDAQEAADQTGPAALRNGLRSADADCGAGIRPDQAWPGLAAVLKSLLRGLEKVNGEWSLICTGHNLLKLFRCGVDLPGRAPLNRSVHRNGDFTETVHTVLSANRPWSEWLRPSPMVVAACSP